ncbi:MAG TPA: HAMP domain-containing sensor histidine kinase [Planctomycetaceae bacterium]|nr:HAMP domain-containing sensor histidine kinase [Planctomycetaceae bacterium]
MPIIRSVRRKLLLSLGLVMAILALQAIGGLSGLVSYRSAIQGLDRVLTGEPRRAEIVTALAWAFEPLMWPALKGEEGRTLRRNEMQQRLSDARTAVAAYLHQLEIAAASPDIRIPSELILREIDYKLAKLMTTELPRVGQPETEDEAIERLRQELSALQLSALRIPKSDVSLDASLSEARSAYRSHFWLISVATVAAVVIFLGLIRCSYLWIFLPIHKLHQGASRVAQGDFSYRVQVSGHDEIKQLAEKFNSMTARFEEIRDKLDREVRERTRQAVRSERLAGVGFLAAGVAHEINNPLSAIAMAAESLEGRLHEAQAAQTGLCADDLGVLQQYLSMIQRESFRCQQITQRLLDFSRGQDAPHTRHDLTKIVREVLDMVGHMSRFRGYEIVFDDSKPVHLDVRGSEIKQVVLNMVANALEAMEGTGRLEIALIERADEVLMTFKDNGCGMTPHVLENLFEPFFTEKKNGRGTGLGLSISHRIVTDHGGRIAAHSEGPGRGSTFEIHLPRRAAAVVVKAA